MSEIKVSELREGDVIVGESAEPLTVESVDRAQFPRIVIRYSGGWFHRFADTTLTVEGDD